MAFVLLRGPPPKENWEKKRRYVTYSGNSEAVLHVGRGEDSRGVATEAGLTAQVLSTRIHRFGSHHYANSTVSYKGRRSSRTWHTHEECGIGFDRGRFFLRRRSEDRGNRALTPVCNSCLDIRRWYWSTHHRRARIGNGRNGRLTRGPARTTPRHSIAWRASLPANLCYSPGNRAKFSGNQLRKHRIRHRSRGSARTTLGQLVVLRVSLSANRDCKLGSRLLLVVVRAAVFLHYQGLCFGDQLLVRRIRKRSRGSARTTPRQLVVWRASLPGNRDRLSGNRVPVFWRSLIEATYKRATSVFTGYLWHESVSWMTTLGTHEPILRGRVLVPGVVAFRPADFTMDITKDERTASFFVVDEQMTIAAQTVALAGPFFGASDKLVDANRLKALSTQNTVEFYLIVNGGIEEGSAKSAPQRLGAVKQLLVTALQDIDGSDGRSCKVGTTSQEFGCITVNKDGEMVENGLSLAVFRLKLNAKTYLTCELVQKSFRLLQGSGQSLLFCDKTVRDIWPSHNTESGTSHLQRLLVPSTHKDQMVPMHTLCSEERVTVMCQKLTDPLARLGLTVNTAMVLYKDVLPGGAIGCTAFVFDPTVVSYLLLAEPGLGSIGKLLFEFQLELIRPLVRSTRMELEDGQIEPEVEQELMWPGLPRSNFYASLKVDLRHPLEGAPLLAPHLLDIASMNQVFQMDPERMGPPPVASIQHFVAGNITPDVVTGYVAAEIIAALSDQPGWHRDHEQLTFDYWNQRVGVQHVWFKGQNTICRILIVVASGRQHQLIVDRFHGTFFPWDPTKKQVVYISYPDCSCMGCQTKHKREYGYGCIDCGSESHFSRAAECPHWQERVQQGESRRAERLERERVEKGGPRAEAATANAAASVSQEAPHGTSDKALPVATQRNNDQQKGAEGQSNSGSNKGTGRGGGLSSGKGGKGRSRKEYNWLCGFCHKPNGAAFHNSKYCVKLFLLPPLSELSRSACLFCNHDHFFMKCPILMDNGIYTLPTAYINMARRQGYPVMEVNGKVVLNLAASLPRLVETSAPRTVGWSGTSSQASSEGGNVGSEISLSLSDDPQSMQVQLQQALAGLGEKLMLEMGRQLSERFSEVTAGMSELATSHNKLQERVLQQTTTTTEMFSSLRQQVEDCRAEAKATQESGDRKLEEALQKMAAATKWITEGTAKGGKGAGGKGVKGLAGTSDMAP